VLNLPLKLAKGQKAAELDAQLAPCRHGLRFRDNTAKNTFDENHYSARKSPMLNLFNLFAKTSGGGDDAKHMKLTSVYRPEVRGVLCTSCCICRAT
jgi:hypothetical protein